MKKHINKTFIILSALLIAVFAEGCTSADEWPSAVTISTTKAVRSDLSAPMNFAGVLIPAQSENIYSKLSGTIADVNADVSSTVVAGDTLIVLNTSEMSAQRSQLSASVKTAQAARNTALAQEEIARVAHEGLLDPYKKTLQLYSAGNASESDLAKLKTQLDTAEAQYNAAKKAVSQAEAAVNAANATADTLDPQLANAIIKSQISGVVTNRNVNPGEVAGPGVALMTVADVSSLKIKCILPQTLLPFIKTGQAADVWADVSPDKAYKGTITRIYPTAVSTGEYFPIEITFKNIDTLKPGLSGHAALSLSVSKAVAVPSSAVVMQSGNTYVYTAKDGKAMRNKVSVGFSDGKTDVITQGLDEGTAVVTGNAGSLFDGVPVNSKEN